METLCRSPPNEDRSSDGHAVLFILPVYQLVLSRLSMFCATTESWVDGGGRVCKNNFQKGFYKVFSSFKPYHSAAEGSLQTMGGVRGLSKEIESEMRWL